MLKYAFVISVLLIVGTCAAQQSSMFCGNPAHTNVYVDAHSGLAALKWKFKTNGKLFASPAVYKGIVYIGSEDHNLYAVEEKSGKFLWKYTTWRRRSFLTCYLRGYGLLRQLRRELLCRAWPRPANSFGNSKQAVKRKLAPKAYGP